jgi:electron transfer flavoprotein-quinone oxidoreductase
MMPRLYGDGMIVVGDAAGFVLNLGYTVRGMDFAIASGEAAARTVMEAKARNDFSEQGLGRYVDFLKQSFVLRDLEAYRKMPDFLENERMYKAYPELVTGLASKLLTVDGTPHVHLLKMVIDQMKESGISLIQLARDGWKGAKSL